MGFKIKSHLKRIPEEESRNCPKIINLKGFNKKEQQALLAALARKGVAHITETGTLIIDKNFSVFVTILTKKEVISGKCNVPTCNVIVTFDNKASFNALNEGDCNILQGEDADGVPVFVVADLFKQEIFPVAGRKCVTRIGAIIDPMVILGVPELADMVSPTTDVSRMWRVIENASTLECLFEKVWSLIQYIVEQCQAMRNDHLEE